MNAVTFVVLTASCISGIAALSPYPTTTEEPTTETPTPPPWMSTTKYQSDPFTQTTPPRTPTPEWTTTPQPTYHSDPFTQPTPPRTPIPEWITTPRPTYHSDPFTPPPPPTPIPTPTQIIGHWTTETTTSPGRRTTAVFGSAWQPCNLLKCNCFCKRGKYTLHFLFLQYRDRTKYSQMTQI
jgi:hypothetical protein